MILWTAFDAVLLSASLLVACLIVDLMTSRGHVVLGNADDAREMDRLTGGALQISDDFVKPDNINSNLVQLSRQDLGIAPSISWMRRTIWGWPAAWAYRSCPVLQNSTRALGALMIGLVLLILLSYVARYWARRLAVSSTLDIVNRLRKSVHRQSLRLGPSDLERRHNQFAQDLFTVQMERIRDGLLEWLLGISRYTLYIVVFVLLALTINWHLTLLCLIPLAASWYIQERQRSRTENKDRLAEDRLSNELKLLAESLHKSRLVRSYGMENFEHDRFQTYLEHFRKNEAAYLQNKKRLGAAAMLIIAACLAVVAMVLITKVLEHYNPFPFAAVLLLLAVFVGLAYAVQGLWQQFRIRRDVTLAADRVLRYINQIPEVGQPVGAKFLQPLSKHLQFEAVTYTLPSTQKKLLDAFDLRMHAGKTTAIVAVEPMSLTALANLLPRFIEPQSGRVLIDGEDIAWGTLESVRAEVIYVSDRDPFFTGTVLENITCGREDYSLQDATEAAKVSHAHNFILKLPQGYETVLGEHGEQLDSGQSFRLGLARAILRNPALLIVEEPIEPLDEDTKSLLDDAYNRIGKGRTVIFLPSRLSTIRRCDQVVFVHEGKVEAVGEHAQLLKTSALYRHWEYVQFNEYRHTVDAGD